METLNGLTGLVQSPLGMRQPYDSYRNWGGSIVRKMRMLLIPLTVVAAIVVMAMTRRPGKARRSQRRSK
jgi:hypothetical protein